MGRGGNLLSDRSVLEIGRLKNEVDHLRRRIMQFGAGNSGPAQDDFYPAIWKNTDDTECPAGGCIRIDDFTTTGGILLGKRPDGTLRPMYALNGDLPVAAGCTGQYLMPGGSLPSRMRADVVTPTKLKSYGPKLNSWEFTEGLDLFFCHGKLTADNIGEGLFQRLRAVLGKPSSTLTKGGTGTFNVWSVVAGVWDACGLTVSAKILEECTADKYANIEWRGEWVAGPAECAT